MIDMHSHILPGVDDGAQNDKGALQMLKAAMDDGVRIQVLTPHIQSGRYDYTRQMLQKAFGAFQEVVAKEGLDIEIRLAAEVRMGPEIMQWVQDDIIPWLGQWEGKRVLLMEFPHDQVPMGSINLIHWLSKQGIVPMIAHPERNGELQRDIRKLESFLDAGCLVQVTSRSLAGGFGYDAHRAAADMLLSGWITILATDCHNMEYRPPDLSAGFRAAAELVGESVAGELVDATPRAILEVPQDGR